MKHLARRGCDGLARLVRQAVVALAVVMLATLSLQVLLRYAFGHALSWSEELALACFSWATLLSIALGVRDAIHVRMDLLVERLPAGWRNALARAVALLIAACGAFVAWAGLRYVADSAGSTSAAIGYPIAYLYACAPVCGLLMTLFALEGAWLGPPPKVDTPNG